MAHHDYLGLEGGNKMIEFIIRMCSLTDEEVCDSLNKKMKLFIAVYQLHSLTLLYLSFSRLAYAMNMIFGT